MLRQISAASDDIQLVIDFVNVDLDEEFMSDHWDDIWEDYHEDYPEETREDWAADRKAMAIDEGHPAAYFTGGKVLPEGIWLIHFTNVDPQKIVNEGFKGREVEVLGLTTAWKQGTREGPYGLAYQAHEIDSPSWSRGKFGAYGQNAVIFKAKEAAEFWHNGDDEFQVVFVTDTVSNAYPVYGSDETLELYGPKFSDGSLFECDRDQHCVDNLVKFLEGQT